MPNIQMPNGDVVAFPDDMPREQIKGMIASKFPEITASSKPKPDTFDTVSDNALQGATFGIGNRAQAGLAALMASGINGKPLGENYKTAREVGTQRLQAEMQENPALAISANLAGGLATGGLGAGTKAGAAVGNSLRTGNLAARIGKGALAGAASGTAYGAGTAAYGKSSEGARSGAISGGLVGGAIPGVGAALSSGLEGSKNAIKGAFARSPEALQDTVEQLKNNAGSLYTQMRDVGAIFKPETSDTILSGIDSAIAKQKFIPALNPKTLAVVQDLKEAAAKGSLGVDDLDQYRRLLSRIAPTEDGVSAGAVKRVIDNTLSGLEDKDFVAGGKKAIELLNQARPQYAQASKLEKVADVLTKADGDPNKIKSGLTRLLNSKAVSSFNESEVAALKDAARSGVVEKLYKMGGKLGIDLGTSLTPGNTIGPIVGGIVNPAVPIAGTASRQAQKYLARGKAENLLRTIEGSGSNLPAISSSPISPLLSAPGGGAAGIISGAETRKVPQMTITPQDKLPMPSVNLPQMAPQSNALFDRVIQAESRGNQSAISPKGAIGVAQIMPRTAIDAARAAGLPYDFKRLQNDPEYNAALGKAYLEKMLDKYGNEAHALIAYNWGPGNADRWIKNGANPKLLPKETRDYIQKILGS